MGAKKEVLYSISRIKTVNPPCRYYPRRNRHFPTFTLEDFLDANAGRDVFVCLKAREDTPEMDKWTTVPFSFCKQVLDVCKRLSDFRSPVRTEASECY